jgi:hypothetical protein
MSDFDTHECPVSHKKNRPACAGRQKSSLRVLIFFKQFLDRDWILVFRILDCYRFFRIRIDEFRWIWIISCFSKVRISGFRWIGSGLSDLDLSLFADTKMEKITPARKIFRPTSISPRRKSIMPDESRLKKHRKLQFHKKRRPRRIAHLIYRLRFIFQPGHIFELRLVPGDIQQVFNGKP